MAIEIPNVRWDDVGGLDDVKCRLKGREWAEKHPDAMKRVGASPPRGVLLYGPPGCSKTMLARAVASASDVTSSPSKGRNCSPNGSGIRKRRCERWWHARSNGAVGISGEVAGKRAARGGEDTARRRCNRVITQLLGEMDGLVPSANVTVVAATNRPDLVDGALLRPGRPIVMYVPPPTSSEDRLAILRVRSRAPRSRTTWT